MTYLAFDMDGTLGDFSILKRLLCIFNQPAFFLKTPEKVVAPSKPELNAILQNSYKRFIIRIIEKEESKAPLGLFRPGIINMFREISALKAANQIKGVIIYSNNHQESLVTAVMDMINAAIGSPVVDRGFFRYNKARTVANAAISNPEKTWAELQHLLVASELAPKEVEPKDVMFFDDLVHKNLKAALTTNYVQVTEYTHNPPLLDLLEVYRVALVDDNKNTVANLKPLMEYIKSCSYEDEKAEIKSYLDAILAAKAKGEYSVKGTGPVPANDTKSVKHMMAAIRKKVAQRGGRKTRRHR